MNPSRTESVTRSRPTRRPTGFRRFTTVLRRTGSAAFPDRDGTTGVQETLARRPDLAVIDWRMPGMDGVEATRRIRASCPDVAIVAFCSTNTPELRDAFLTAGADAFVDKRDVSGLIAAVHAIAERRTQTDD